MFPSLQATQVLNSRGPKTFRKPELDVALHNRRSAPLDNDPRPPRPLDRGTKAAQLNSYL